MQVEIKNDIPPKDPKYHILGSHVICESGDPIIRSTLWNCIRKVRILESEMIRAVEHSPFTIIPSDGNVRFSQPTWEVEDEY